MPDPEAEAATDPPNHPGVLGAIVEEVGAYLAEPEVPRQERHAAAQRAFAGARADFEAFAESACHPRHRGRRGVVDPGGRGP